MDDDADERLARRRFRINLTLGAEADFLALERLIRDNYGPAVSEMNYAAGMDEDGAPEETLRVVFNGEHACREARGNMLRVLIENAAPLGVVRAWLE